MEMSKKKIADATKTLITNGHLRMYKGEWSWIKNYLRSQGMGLLLSHHHYQVFHEPYLSQWVDMVDISLWDTGLENRIDNILWEYDKVEKDLHCMLGGESVPRINHITKELLHLTESWGLDKTPEGYYLRHEGSRENLPKGEDLLPSREVIESWKEYDFPIL